MGAKPLLQVWRRHAERVVVYYPPREFLGQQPYRVGHIQMVEGVNLPAPVMGVDPDAVEVGTRVAADACAVWVIGVRLVTWPSHPRTIGARGS